MMVPFVAGVVNFFILIALHFKMFEDIPFSTFQFQSGTNALIGKTGVYIR